MAEPHWLDYYGSPKYQWQNETNGNRTRHWRPLGLTERSFDADGKDFEGRADITDTLVVEIKTSLTCPQLQRRILLAWTVLRCQQLLLQAISATSEDIGVESAGPRMDVCFALDLPHQADLAIADAEKEIVFLENHFSHVDPRDFSFHSQNATRVVDAKRSLARFFVFPLETTTHPDLHRLRLVTIMSHGIADGVSGFIAKRNMVHLLNLSESDLLSALTTALQPASISQALPLPQEALYPPITGSRARQRWFWLLTRILRHVRKPLPAGFPNPLRRTHPLPSAASPPPKYSPALTYTVTPPLNAIHLSASTNRVATHRLHSISKAAHVSIGAGIFALAAAVTMEAYEIYSPSIPLSERKPFIAAFPLNPRAFFSHSIDPNSMMLSFSDGIAFPFVSSDSGTLENRLALLARHAQRGLDAYQKRIRSAGEGKEELSAQMKRSMGTSRGAGRVLATSYLASLERSGTADPQGSYPARQNGSMATCGVSSVGRRDAFIAAGMYDLSREVGVDKERDLIADYRDMDATVRPREGEFLVGSSGSANEIGVGISADANSIDPERVKGWLRRWEEILLPGLENVGAQGKAML